MVPYLPQQIAVHTCIDTVKLFKLLDKFSMNSEVSCVHDQRFSRYQYSPERFRGATICRDHGLYIIRFLLRNVTIDNPWRRLAALLGALIGFLHVTKLAQLACCIAKHN